jgi:hypothetical protein
MVNANEIKFFQTIVIKKFENDNNICFLDKVRGLRVGQHRVLEPVLVNVKIGGGFLDGGIVHGRRECKITVRTQWNTHRIQVVKWWRLTACLDIFRHWHLITPILVGEPRHGRIFFFTGGITYTRHNQDQQDRKKQE